MTVLAAGCSKPQGASLQHLDPTAPAAQGYPAYSGPDKPTPLVDRVPFGLMTAAPNPETVSLLAIAAPSPNGRFRAAISPQGLWVTRIDGGWLWSVQLPGPPAPPPPPPGTAAQTPPPPAPKPPDVVGPIRWTPNSTIVFKDTTGTWHEANPDFASITALPPALQGKDMISYSPNGKQVLYYTPVKGGSQLWVANVDGSNAKLMGENLAALWDSASKLVISQPVPPTPTPAPPSPGQPFGAAPVPKPPAGLQPQ